MNNLVEKFILAAAKRIEDKKLKVEKLKNKESTDINNLYKTYEDEAEKLIGEFIDSIKDNMNNSGCHLNPGDTAILNIYELDYACKNGWDSGPSAILKNISEDVRRKPLKVRITNVKISRSYYTDNLDRFFNKYYGPYIKKMIDNGELIEIFKDFMSDKLWSENYGLYWDVFFEPINFEFNPVWGLNSGSFLLEGTNGASITESYWIEHGEILSKWDEINNEKNRFEFNLSKMVEIYKLGYYEKEN